MNDVRPSAPSSGPPHERDTVRPLVRNEVTGGVIGTVVQARLIQGNINVQVHSPPQAVALSAPNQLPRPPSHFVGRASDLARLRMVSDRAPGPLLLVLAGMAGVGKTALALRWLHGQRDGRDGSLFIDLRGFSGAERVPALDALGQFLRGLGVPSEQLPSGAAELAALYRSVTAGRNLLILLDNAASAEQVRPLLPGSGPSIVVVTSRRTLRSLAAEGAVLHRVLPFDARTGADLLRELGGAERVADEPGSAEQIVELCGGLAVAVSVTGARLAARPDLTLRQVSTELSKHPGLRQFDLDADLSVEAALDASYRELPRSARRTYRLLGLHPGPTVTISLTAILTGLPVTDAARDMDFLVDCHLLQPIGHDRFQFHDLLRRHARRTARRAESRPLRDTAIRRALEYWLAAADAADRAIMPHRWRPVRRYSTAVRHTPTFASDDNALAWLETEHENLAAGVRLAARRRWPELVWQLADVMWGFYLLRQFYEERLEIHRLAVAAARKSDSAEVLGLILNHHGLGLKDVGRLSDALAAFEEALASYQAAGDRRGIATAFNSLGLTLEALGRWDDAAEMLLRAATIQAELGQRRAEALTRANLGRIRIAQHRPSEGTNELDWARQVFAASPDAYNEARAMTDLGTAYVQLGDLAAAEPHLTAALAAMRRLGSRRGEAEVLQAMSHAALLSNDDASAGALAEGATTLFRYDGVGAKAPPPSFR